MKNTLRRKKTDEAKEAKLPQVKRAYSLRLFMLFASGITAVAGLVMFAIYFVTQNIAFGGPSVFMLAVGIFLFKYYWSKSDDVITEHIGEVKKVQVNSLCIYPDKVLFEDVVEPEGYPWACLNDHKKYFVNIWDLATKRLIPFVLPDQQYYDPVVFAERVLALPAHRKIFRRKEKLLQKLKTAMLVLAIGIVWLLIMTTTGGS